NDEALYTTFITCNVVVVNKPKVKEVHEDEWVVLYMWGKATTQVLLVLLAKLWCKGSTSSQVLTTDNDGLIVPSVSPFASLVLLYLGHIIFKDGLAMTQIPTCLSLFL
ncbi:hypothetical protein ACJX0J_020697, partial [Zea mays]